MFLNFKNKIKSSSVFSWVVVCFLSKSKRPTATKELQKLWIRNSRRSSNREALGEQALSRGRVKDGQSKNIFVTGNSQCRAVDFFQ
jgi:hypothetical protein